MSEGPAFVYIIQNSNGRVKIGQAKDVVLYLASLQTVSIVPLSIAYRVKAESQALAVAIEKRVHSMLSEHRLPGDWFAVAPGVAKRVLVEAVIGEAQTSEPCTIMSGRNEVPLSPELTKRVQKLAAAMGIAESAVVNRVLLTYCRRLSPKDLASALFDPESVEDVAEKVFTAVKTHRTSNLARSVLVRKRGFSKISEVTLNAAIARLKSAGRISEKRNGLSIKFAGRTGEKAL